MRRKVMGQLGWLGVFAVGLFVLPVAVSYGAEGKMPSRILTADDDGRRVVLTDGRILELELEGNPSTGYAWDVVRLDQRVLKLLGEKWHPVSDLLGSPEKQVFRFAGIKRGQTQLTLVYRRSWEKDRAPLRTVSYSIDVVEAVSNISALDELDEEGEEDQEEVSAEAESRTFGKDTNQALPSSFNWCTQGICPPVRDQGQCGSCWAFATVAPFEALVKLKDGQMKDMSEQYLVSCNVENWGCNGGWWAHDYHINKVPPGEPSAGAVYENEFPYVAKDVACGGPHKHEEKLLSWSYVGTFYGVPSVSAIKEAIYAYGPVSAGVCVNRAFQTYRGGVFSSSKSCPRINHAIVLVGWDDAEGVWILRNSYGPNWGENGYMRIKYGQNSVGYGANFVIYK
ncbi:C1 family peptidase [Desulfosoma sp.]